MTPDRLQEIKKLEEAYRQRISHLLLPVEIKNFLLVASEAREGRAQQYTTKAETPA